jgi:hypothetical protein
VGSTTVKKNRVLVVEEKSKKKMSISASEKERSQTEFVVHTVTPNMVLSIVEASSLEQLELGR